MSTSSAGEPLAIFVADTLEATHENHQKLLSHLPGVGVSCFADPLKALQAAHSSGVDLLVVSLAATAETVAFVKQVRLAEPAVPIIAIAKEAAVEKEDREHAYEAGVMTLLDQRPIDPVVYLNAARTALGFAMLRRDEKKKLQDAQNRIAAVQAEIEKREAICIETMRKMAGLADPELAQRMAAVATIARQIAQQMRLEDARRLEAATRIYDIGMLGVPAAVRARRNDPLGDKDAAALQTHTNRCPEIFGSTPMGLLGLAWAVAAAHHERYDGNGYPNHLAGDKIPIHARIVAVAEAFYDNTRPVGGIPSSPVAALQKIQRQELTAFDPLVIAALAHVVERTAAALSET